VTVESRQTVGVVAASGAMVGWAASGVIAKGIDLGALAVVFWRMWIYAIVIVGFMYATGRPLSKRAMRIALPGGIALSADIMLFFSSVKLTTVANATVIGAMQPVLMLALAHRLFGEQPLKRDWGLAIVGISGVVIVMFGSAGVPEWSAFGDFLAFLTLFAWTAYFIFSKLTRSQIDAFEYTAATALTAAIVTSPFALVSGQLAEMPDSASWLWLVILALGPGFASHLLMNWSLGYIPAWLGSTLSLAIPVTSTVLAWMFLDETVVAIQFLGMTIVMVALGAIVVGQARPRLAASPPVSRPPTVPGARNPEP
jgi:drug/metabolite transporter (DMT)-like permease